MSLSRSSSTITVVKVTCISLVLLFVIATLSTPPETSPTIGKGLPSSIRSSLSRSDIAMTSPVSVLASLPKINLRFRSAPTPPFLYGTAWKKERTEELVDLAVRTGFRGIDTACQPKHYYEPGVGNALEKLIKAGVITRGDIFLQSKYTPIRGQDPNDVPYDENSSYEDQVITSYFKSLSNLKTDYLDSLVLHSPLSNIEDTMKVWETFEKIKIQGGLLNIGQQSSQLFYRIDFMKNLDMIKIFVYFVLRRVLSISRSGPLQRIPRYSRVRW
mmetsp:Transcript_13159/g.12733  ORF Transcript_13159/g.12733 Transcript_13159/m.12733 type:complete len:272 (+) Transcript_13159:167-982(+)